MSGGRAQKAKGSQYERDVARAFQTIFGPGVWRADQRDPGFCHPDVAGTPFWLECKVGKRVSVRAAMKQAEADWHQRGRWFYRFPAVVSKEDRGVDLVTLRLTDFLELLAGLRKGGRQ